MNEREIEACLPQFEGLIAETTRQTIAAGVELEYDDVRQLLSIKVWQAVVAYDADHARQLPLRRFVFGCLYNLRKDIEKRPRRHNRSIDEIRGKRLLGPGCDTPLADWFDAHYLAVDAEQVYGEVEDEPVTLPCTLTALERRVLRLRLAGRLLLEIDREAGLSRAERERVMGSIREKLADWAPSPPARPPRRPLPDVTWVTPPVAASSLG